jgi:hypothetical protein
MKKLIRKVKKLFIEELEVRRSTSPLLVQTMAVGEAGVSIKNNKEGSSSAGALDSAQKAKEAMIAEKNDSTNIVALYAPPSPVTSMNLGEEGNEISKKTEENGRPPVQPLYAAPKPTNKIAESGKPPVQPLYAAPKPTNKIAESGKPPILIAAPSQGKKKITILLGENGKPRI